jgi:hypothetical protein
MRERPMDPALNTTVQAILNAERITAGCADNSALFDPAWSPVMHRVAERVMAGLRSGLTEGTVRLRYHDYDGGVDLDDRTTEAVLIHDVGSKYALVCCRANASLDDRTLRGADYYRNMLEYRAEIDDYWQYGDTNNSRYIADYELRCTVNIADDCSAPLSPDVGDFGGGTTRLMPMHLGPYVLLFRCCRGCEAKAGRDAETNFKISVMEAQAKLPPGAVIDPGSPVPPTP